MAANDKAQTVVSDDNNYYNKLRPADACDVSSAAFSEVYSSDYRLINTIIKTTSVCERDARSVGGERGWLAGDTDGLAVWPVTVGVVSQPGADAERYSCACLHCTQGLAGRGDGYQCGLGWGRSRSALKSRKSRVVLLTALQICPFLPYSLSLSFNFVKTFKGKCTGTPYLYSALL